MTTATVATRWRRASERKAHTSSTTKNTKIIWEDQWSHATLKRGKSYENTDEWEAFTWDPRNVQRLPSPVRTIHSSLTDPVFVRSQMLVPGALDALRIPGHVINTDIARKLKNFTIMLAAGSATAVVKFGEQYGKIYLADCSTATRPPYEVFTRSTDKAGAYLFWKFQLAGDRTNDLTTQDSQLAY